MPPFQQNSMFPEFREPSFFSLFPPRPQSGFPPLFPTMTREIPPVPSPPTSTGGLTGILSSLMQQGAGQSGGGVNLFGMLMNAQKAIQTAQTMIPMIQQFGPLIKNAPAILGVLKSMQSSEKSAEETDTETPEHEEEKNEKKTDEAAEKPTPSLQTTPRKTVIKTRQEAESLRDTDQLKTKPSKPRMYI